MSTHPSETANRDTRPKLVLVTGMSGAGKSTVLKALEDLNFEALDNLPLNLLGPLLNPPERDWPDAADEKPLAIGVDIRTRDFGVQSFRDHLDRLKAHGGRASVEVVFMDCDDEELRRRYTETRRKHPLAMDRPIEDGIALERRHMAAIADWADSRIDTTVLKPGELRAILDSRFARAETPGLTVFVTSFSYRRGIPRQADLVFDVRFLANPHYVPALKPLTGETDAVGDHVSADPRFGPFFDNLTRLLAPLLPAYRAEGKNYLTIAMGCTGGKHRSVFAARRLAAWLREQDQRVRLDHRDMPKNTMERTRRDESSWDK